MIQDLLIGLAQGGIYALTGVGLVLIFSVVRVPNFAHGEPVMLGAMLTLTLVSSFGLPIPLAILTGILASALLGWLFSVFYYSYTFSQFGAGPFLDRWNLRWAYGLAVLAWSLVAGLTSLATGFGSLLVFRMLLGVDSGERSDHSILQNSLVIT